MSAPALLARALALVEALAGHGLHGQRLKQIAERVRQSAPITLRDLQALEYLGWAERIADREDCWRLTARPVQLALAHQHELARATQRLADLENRYSRLPV